MKNPLLHIPSSVSVYRSGCRFNDARYTRVSYRSRNHVVTRFSSRGFRLFRTLELK